MTRKITGAVILAVIVVVIGYDIAIAVEPTGDDTISRVFLDWATRHPFLSYAWGVLAGHLMWPLTSADRWRKWRLGSLIASGVVVLALDVCGVLPGNLTGLGLIAGVVAGHYGWPQKTGDSQGDK